eukprot:scaffold1511_cov170-Amphora_coffeaeformis.AAC.15
MANRRPNHAIFGKWPLSSIIMKHQQFSSEQSTMLSNLAKWAVSAVSPNATMKSNTKPAAPVGWYPSEGNLLLRAAQTNRPTEILRLVKLGGVSPNHANQVGLTALHIAALWGHVDCVAMLVSKDIGANPNATNLLSRATPLHMLIQGRKIREAPRLHLIIDVLLDAGADPNLADAMGRLPVDYITNTTPDAVAVSHKLQPSLPPLFEAIQSGDFSKVLALFYAGHQSPQTLACQQYDNITTVQAVVDLMVGSVVDPWAPLDATLQADLDLLRILLVCGARPTAVETTHRSFNDSMETDQDEEVTDMRKSPIVRLLDGIQGALGNYKGNEIVNRSFSTSLSLPPIVRLWLEACQALQDRFEQSDEYGESLPPLLSADEVAGYWHNAARRGQLPFMKALHHYLPTLFDVNAVNRQGMTAIHFAARSGQVSIVLYLLSLPSTKVFQPDTRGKTALDAAHVNGHATVVELLQSAMLLTLKTPTSRPSGSVPVSF